LGHLAHVNGDRIMVTDGKENTMEHKICGSQGAWNSFILYLEPTKAVSGSLSMRLPEGACQLTHYASSVAVSMNWPHLVVCATRGLNCSPTRGCADSAASSQFNNSGAFQHVMAPAQGTILFLLQIT